MKTTNKPSPIHSEDPIDQAYRAMRIYAMDALYDILNDSAENPIGIHTILTHYLALAYLDGKTDALKYVNRTPRKEK